MHSKYGKIDTHTKNTGNLVNRINIRFNTMVFHIVVPFPNKILKFPPIIVCEIFETMDTLSDWNMVYSTVPVS